MFERGLLAYARHVETIWILCLQIITKCKITNVGLADRYFVENLCLNLCNAAGSTLGAIDTQATDTNLLLLLVLRTLSRGSEAMMSAMVTFNLDYNATAEKVPNKLSSTSDHECWQICTAKDCCWESRES